MQRTLKHALSYTAIALSLGTAAAAQAGELQMPPTMQPDKHGWRHLTATSGSYGIVNGPSAIATRSYVPAGETLLVGPTVRAKPGEKVKIRYVNALPYSVSDGDAYMSDTVPHGFDVINLHAHGLHVSPRGHSDNVLVNLLPQDTPKEGMEACKHGTHHDVDHPHLCVKGTFDYEYKIPKDHPAGTYWYHPHKHGAVSLHLGSGMAGAFIIEDDRHGIDSLPAVKAAKAAGGEKVLVLQEITYATTASGGNAVNCLSSYGPGNPPLCVYPGGSTPAANTGNINAKLSVNGQYDATITMAPGEAQLWRVVNATVGNVQPMCLVPVGQQTAAPPTLYALAADGVPIQRPLDALPKSEPPFVVGAPVAILPPGTPAAATGVVNNELLFMAAGQRLDLMVQAPAQPGQYALLQPDPANPPAIGGLCQPATAPIPETQLVLYVNVVQPSGSTPVNSAIPTQAELNTLRVPRMLAGARDVPAGPTQGVVYGFTSSTYASGIGGASVINGRPFNAQRVQRKLKLDQMDLWGVQSAADTHMFHIHINPFQIVKRGTVDYAFPVWRDTALINCAPTAEQGGSNCTFPGGLTNTSSSASISNNYGEVLQFLSRAVDFTGPMVMHCHNVGHEDNGMMELVELVK